MTSSEQLIAINSSELVSKAEQMSKDGYRLVQISCTLTESFEITYSFDKEYNLINLRIIIAKTDPIIPSITGSFLCAFTYENELQDLFGLTVKDMQLNFNGNFYQTTFKTPFNNPGISQKPGKSV
jgi:ech hydrogenase subunit D